jgi:hypothetical protein
MAGLIKPSYAASVALTVTNLHSLSASQTWIAGWTSASVTNSTPYADYLIGGTFTSHASNRAAGSINVYAIGFLNDTPTIPATSSGTLGTEGAVAFADTYRRDSLVRLLTSIPTDTTASAIYTFPQTGIAQLFGGRVPNAWALVVAHNISTTTTAGLAAAGSALYYTPVMDQYT